MEDYGAMIRNTFELGSVRDAEALFEACIQNAFPLPQTGIDPLHKGNALYGGPELEPRI